MIFYLFIDKVDAKLFKCIEFENFKTSNIQDTNEVDFLHGGVNQGVIAHVNEVSEQTTKDVLDDGRDSNSDSSQVLGLVDPLSADLVLGIDEAVIENFTCVSKMEYIVDYFAGIKILGRSHLSHACKLHS